MLLIHLLRPTARAIDWIPLLATGLLSVTLTTAIDAGSPLDPGTALTLLRMSGLLLGAAAGFAVPDEMAPSTAATPVSRALRHRIRYAAAGLTAAAFWTTACLVATVRLPEGDGLRIPGMAAEAAACVAAGLLTATTATRLQQGKAAALTGMGGLLAAFSITLVLRGPYWPWLYPGEPAWEPVHLAWLTALPLLLTALDLIGQGPRRTR